MFLLFEGLLDAAGLLVFFLAAAFVLLISFTVTFLKILWRGTRGEEEE